MYRADRTIISGFVAGEDLPVGRLCTIYNGLVSLAEPGVATIGLVYQAGDTYRPTGNVCKAGSTVSILTGNAVIQYCPPDLFVGCSLPGVGELLYTSDGGMLDTSPDNPRVGRCVGHTTLPGTNTEVAVVLFDFGAGMTSGGGANGGGIPPVVPG